MSAKAVRAYVSAATRDALRGQWLRRQARRPGAAAVRWEALLLGGLGLGLLGTVGWWLGVAGRLWFSAAASTDGWLAAAAGTILVGTAVSTAAIAALGVLLQCEAAAPWLEPWPLPKRWLLLPTAAAGLMEAGVWFGALVCPSVLFLGGLLGLGVGATCALTAAHAALSLGIAACMLAGGAAILACPGPSRAAALGLLGVVAAAGAAGVAVALARVGLDWVAGLQALGRWGERWLGSWVGDLPRALPSWWVVAGGVAGSLAAALAACLSASHLLVRAARQASLRRGRRPQHWPALSGWLAAGRGEALGPFVRLELLTVSRSPGRLAREMLLLAVCLAALVLAFEGKDALVAAYLLNFVPIVVAGQLVLPSVGWDGSLVTLVALAGRVNDYLRSKLLVGLASASLVTSLATVFILVGWPMGGSGSGAILVVTLPITVLVGVALAVGWGSVFADRRVRRLFPSQGVRLGAELAFWGSGGSLAIATVLMWRGLTAARPALIVAGIAAALFLGTVAAVLIICGASALRRTE